MPPRNRFLVFIERFLIGLLIAGMVVGMYGCVQMAWTTYKNTHVEKVKKKQERRRVLTRAAMDSGAHALVAIGQPVPRCIEQPRG